MARNAVARSLVTRWRFPMALVDGVPAPGHAGEELVVHLDQVIERVPQGLRWSFRKSSR